ncbi:MAG: hypothetical protein HQL06_13370 [Nitrospirae bacterium]|nr:hypothetical protein [Nitrospirota bacterium]
MLLAAKEEGYYRKDVWGDRFDKIQILTVEKLLNGENIKLPSIQTTTVKTAERKAEGIDEPELSLQRQFRNRTWQNKRFTCFGVI